MIHLPDLNYACLNCGYSCSGLQVEVSLEEAEAILAIDSSSLEDRDNRSWLRKKACGSCSFYLDEESEANCKLHREHGLVAKPRACRRFPFRAVTTPGGTFVGASFACTAIFKKHGPPLRAEGTEWSLISLPDRPLAPGLGFDWDRYLGWENGISKALDEGGLAALWTEAFKIRVEIVGYSTFSLTNLEERVKRCFRGLLALAEGPMQEEELLAFLKAWQNHGNYYSNLCRQEIDVDEVLRSWQDPWPLEEEAIAFFQHLLFRKYLLEGPDVYSRICSLPILAQLLQFWAMVKPKEREIEDLHWAFRTMEERLTFHARGLANYLGACGEAFLGD